MIQDEFDPFRVVVSFASEANMADTFIEVFTGAGLSFDLSLAGKDDFSHGNRIRALRPRVLAAYDQLSSEAKLAAANAATSRLLSYMEQLAHMPKLQDFPARLKDGLQKIGWDFQQGQLVTADAKVREMFFPKNSQWDAFVAIRKEIDKAKKELVLVDPYCDREFFGILQSSSAHPQNIRLLCRNNAAALKAEAKAFAAQFPGRNIELRTSTDFHDRFLVIDQSICVHIGASINHAGTRAFMISVVEDERNRTALIKAVNDAWNAGTPV